MPAGALGGGQALNGARRRSASAITLVEDGPTVSTDAATSAGPTPTMSPSHECPLRISSTPRGSGGRALRKADRPPRRWHPSTRSPTSASWCNLGFLVRIRIGTPCSHHTGKRPCGTTCNSKRQLRRTPSSSAACGGQSTARRTPNNGRGCSAYWPSEPGGRPSTPMG